MARFSVIIRLLYFALLLVLLVACNPAIETSPTASPTIPGTEVTTSACESIVSIALDLTSDACGATERNQACYGNGRIDAHLRQTDSLFDQPGQRIDLGLIESLQLAALDATSGEWGVALLRVQANLPDTLPGQNVTLLIFGNTEVRTVDAGDNPQAFYFQSGVGTQISCNAAPLDGMLIQTPEGAGNIDLSFNNVQIKLGSTAFLQAQPESEMVVNVVEGQAVVTADDKTETIPAGARTRIPLDAAGLAAGQPSPAEPYDVTTLQTLPIQPLQRTIEIAPPFIGSRSFAPIGFQVEDAISQAGEVDEYRFTAEAGQQIYFDGEANDTNLRWSLTAPDGTTLFEDDVVQFDYDTLMLEQAGTYTLSVFGIVNMTGDYAFQIWDVPGNDPVSISIVNGIDAPMVSGAIETPGVIDVYTFEADAGQQIYWDGEANDTNLRWDLTAPDGTVLFNDDVVQFDYDTLMLEQSGEYILIVDAIGDITGDYQFRILDVPMSDPVALIIGDGLDTAMTSGSIETPGVIDTYTFAGEAGQQVYFDGEANNSNLRWYLTAPDGTNIFQNEVVLFDYDTLMLEQSGEYVLTVDGLNAIIEEYQLRILDVPISDPVALVIGDGLDTAMTSGSIETPGVIDVYTFTGEAGQQVYLDGEANNSNLRWYLTAPDGTNIFQNEVVLFDYDTFTLEQSGEYMLTVDAFSDIVEDYQLRVLNVQISEPVAITIVDGTSDEMIAGAIEAPGVIDTYVFEGETGQQLRLNGEADSTNLRWTLTAPDGTNIFFNEVLLFGYDAVTLEQSGEYFLTVDGLGGLSETVYQFQIQVITTQD